jgi:hypothetical protein
MVCATPRNDLHPQKWFAPPETFGTAPQSFCTPGNYIYFDLIVSYLIILTTKFVKLPILWSQISPCRPRKQILLNFFLGFSGRCHQAPAKASSSTPPDIYPPSRMKIWKSVTDTNSFPGSKAGMTSFFDQAPCQGKLVNFLSDALANKLVKEKLLVCAVL